MSSTIQGQVYLDPAGQPTGDASRAPRRALFLDRDGVINVNSGYVHTAKATDWLPGIFDACRAAREAGFVPVVVTNQAGIARGLFSEQQFLDYTRWVHEQFARQGATLEATFYCPHHPTAGIGDGLLDCQCRKPKPGMLKAAESLLDLDLAQSVLVGDAESDIQAAAAAGVGRALLFDPSTTGQASSNGTPRLHSLADLPSLLGWCPASPATGEGHP